MVLFAHDLIRKPVPIPIKSRTSFSGSCARYFSACARFAMSSTLMRPSTDENVRSASTSAGFTTSLTSAELGSGGSSASSAVLARELVAAVRSAYAAQDAFAHQRLQNWFEMAWWKLMARRQRLGRDRPASGR
jgi:hypothetical protein